MKKLLLSLGTVASIATPIATTIACGKKTQGPVTIVELGSKSDDKKYFLSVTINLAFGFDRTSNAKEVAENVIKENKSSFDDSKTKIILKTPVGKVEKTFREFKNLAPIPSELVTKIKDAELKKYIEDVFKKLKTNAQ